MMQEDGYWGRQPIRQAEIQKFRRNLKIGAVVSVEIEYLDRRNNRFFSSKGTKMKVVCKYNHVVVLRDPRTGKEHHTTYIELMLNERRALYGETTV